MDQDHHLPDISRNALEQWRLLDSQVASVTLKSPQRGLVNHHREQSKQTQPPLQFSFSASTSPSNSFHSGLGSHSPNGPCHQQLEEQANEPSHSQHVRVDPMDILKGRVKPTLTAAENSKAGRRGLSLSNPSSPSTATTPTLHFPSTGALRRTSPIRNGSSSPQRRAQPASTRRMVAKAASAHGLTRSNNPFNHSQNYNHPSTSPQRRSRTSHGSLSRGKLQAQIAVPTSPTHMDPTSEEEALAQLGITGRFKPRLPNAPNRLKLPVLEREKAVILSSPKNDDLVTRPQQRFAERNAAVSRARHIKAAKSHAAHRQTQKYIMVGSKAPLSKRFDMSEEEILKLEQLSLVPAPELFFGKGISSSNNMVRRRQLERGIRSRRESAEQSLPTVLSGNGLTAPVPDPVPEEREAEAEEGVGDECETQSELANDSEEPVDAETLDDDKLRAEVASVARQALATPDTSVIANKLVHDMPLGWAGTELDKPEGRLRTPGDPMVPPPQTIDVEPIVEEEEERDEEAAVESDEEQEGGEEAKNGAVGSEDDTTEELAHQQSPEGEAEEEEQEQEQEQEDDEEEGVNEDGEDQDYNDNEGDVDDAGDDDNDHGDEEEDGDGDEEEDGDEDEEEDGDEDEDGED